MFYLLCMYVQAHAHRMRRGKLCTVTPSDLTTLSIYVCVQESIYLCRLVQNSRACSSWCWSSSVNCPHANGVTLRRADVVCSSFWSNDVEDAREELLMRWKDGISSSWADASARLLRLHHRDGLFLRPDRATLEEG